MAKPGPSSMVRLTSRMKAREASSVEVVRPQQQQRQRLAIERRDDAVQLLLDRGGQRDASGVGGQSRRRATAARIAGGRRHLAHGTIPARLSRASSSLIEVFERVRSSTVFTITAQ